MFRIVPASKGRNTSWISSNFHLVSWSIRAETIGKSSKGLGGEMTLYVVGVGSYLSSQMCINWLFPTLHCGLLLITFKTWKYYTKRMMGCSQALSSGHPHVENTLLYRSKLVVNGDLRASWCEMSLFVFHSTSHNNLSLS